MVSLTKGQSISLVKSGGGSLSRITMGLGWDVRKSGGFLGMFGDGGDVDLDARYDLTGAGSHTGQVMAKISRSGGGWDMKAIGDKTTGRTFHDMMPAIQAHL